MSKKKDKHDEATISVQQKFIYLFIYLSRRGPGHIVSKTSVCIFKTLRFEKFLERFLLALEKDPRKRGYDIKF